MANWNSAGMGALTGAASGAALGSIFPGIGTAIGAGAGGLLGGLSGLAGDPGSRKAEELRFQRFSPQQQGLFNPIISQALSQLGNQNFNFSPIAQQARTNFGQSTIPSIAERFSSFGAQGSNAFSQALGQAGAGLEQGLAGMQQDYGLQQQQLLHNLLSLGLTPQFESAYSPRQPGIFEQGASSIAQYGPMLAAMKYLK